MNKVGVFIVMLLAVFGLHSCDCRGTDQLFYKDAQLLDIKRDDEGEYHLLVKYIDGSLECIPDAKCSLKMGNYNPSAGMPFVKWENCRTNGVLRAWHINSTKYSYEAILIYLPDNYEIPLFND